MADQHTDFPPVIFETHPSRYRHLLLDIDGPIARLALKVQESGGLRPGYELKLNSYDLSVDIELADAIQRLRFEHPQVAVVVITSALDGVFCAGANIFMLGSSTHGFKVNFCKFTNETRLYIEDACENSGQTYVAALNGVASGGGYELPLACKEIYLVDDRKSAVSLPEIPYLGVLPGTGGITRVVDKRKVRKDRADHFLCLAEGIKGKRAKDWNLVDEVFPLSKFNEKVQERANALAQAAPKKTGHKTDHKGVTLEPLNVRIDKQGMHYQYVDLSFGDFPRTATIQFTVPDDLPPIPQNPAELGSSWWPLQAYRELDDLLLRLRFNYPEIGLVLLTTRGNKQTLLDLDKQLLARADHWFVNEVLHHQKRVFKRLDVTSKSFFAVVDKDSCFVGSLLEFVLAADRAFILAADGVELALSPMNFGTLPMGNGQSRLQMRLIAEPEQMEQMADRQFEMIDAQTAEQLGLVLAAWDEIDWDDELRLAIEERASLSPDALTGMENNVRFAGPETVETKIFGRLSAWQNWIFQRPNAVGEHGALSLYGRPETPEFDWRRT